MKKILVVTATMIAVGTFAFSAQAKGKFNAKAEFAKNCAVCHPGGGNIINKDKPLTKSALAKNGIKDWEAIVGKMRNPGPGMTTFGKEEISDKHAKAIAEYVLKTFK